MALFQLPKCNRPAIALIVSVVSRRNVLGQVEAQELVTLDPRRGQIISVWGKLDGSPASFESPKRILHLGFDDVTADDPGEGLFAATEADIARALEFAREAWPGPLLIHCHAVISRSPALAWVVLWDRLGATLPAAREALEIVRRVRPEIEPNPHIMRLGVMQLCGEARSPSAFQRERSR